MTGFLRGLWYFAGHASEFPKGRMAHKVILGEPLLLGRGSDGQAFALRDICPHRGVPLSAGRLEGTEVECPYHGWRFRTGDGVCSAIPALVPGQDTDPAKIRVRRYPLHEAAGMVWAYFAPDDAPREAAPAVPPPALPLVRDSLRPTLIERQVFPCGIDHAVIGLMDPAHGPFVHGSWFWRSKASIHEKAKRYIPNPTGFTMAAHAPSKNAGLYKILGGKPVTEIAFHLPSLRIENIRVGAHQVLGVTTCTPLTESETEVTQTFFWTMPWLSLLKPVLRPFARTFMEQDRAMVALQRQGLRFNPTLMLIRDADQPAIWYHRLKKEWAEAQGQGRPFANPVQETVLRWRS